MEVGAGGEDGLTTTVDEDVELAAFVTMLLFANVAEVDILFNKLREEAEMEAFGALILAGVIPDVMFVEVDAIIGVPEVLFFEAITAEEFVMPFEATL